MGRAEAAMLKKHQLQAAVNVHFFGEAGEETKHAITEDAMLTPEDVTALRPFYRARNRWGLALLLLQNPSLMKFRKHRLPQKQATDDDGVLATIATTAGQIATKAGDLVHISTGEGTGVEMRGPGIAM